MLYWGIAVLLSEYKADVGRFRWVGARAMRRSGSWDDKVEHLVADLWTQDKDGPQIFVIKVSSITPVPDMHFTKEEEAMMSYALDQV